jgi:hypothetical protein
VPVDRPEAQPPARRCDFCHELIQPQAKKCKHCGELLDPVLRANEEARRAAEMRHAHAASAPAPVMIHNNVVTNATATAKAAVTARPASSCLGCLTILFVLWLIGYIASLGGSGTPKVENAPPPSPRPAVAATPPARTAIHTPGRQESAAVPPAAAVPPVIEPTSPEGQPIEFRVAILGQAIQVRGKSTLPQGTALLAVVGLPGKTGVLAEEQITVGAGGVIESGWMKLDAALGVGPFVAGVSTVGRQPSSMALCQFDLGQSTSGPSAMAGGPQEAQGQPEPAAEAKASDSRAATTLRMGKGLEKLNPKAAIGYYEQVVREYPESAEAEAAAKRIEALRKKR